MLCLPRLEGLWGTYFRFHLFIFRERGREGEERERNINAWLPLTDPILGTWPTTQACALTGNQTGNPLVHRPALNPLSHTARTGELTSAQDILILLNI